MAEKLPLMTRLISKSVLIILVGISPSTSKPDSLIENDFARASTTIFARENNSLSLGHGCIPDAGRMQAMSEKRTANIALFSAGDLESFLASL